ncbi:biotin/lipoyl-containing protein [Pseudonocardia eucalypti]|uniref:biotin/lipoyl-containing protein n=1 Tax=Pseudonocardia eucalypti TaxID=648755 RepID=UPI001C88CDB3
MNDPLVEIETAKSLVELPSPSAGEVAALLAQEGSAGSRSGADRAIPRPNGRPTVGVRQPRPRTIPRTGPACRGAGRLRTPRVPTRAPTSPPGHGGALGGDAAASTRARQAAGAQAGQGARRGTGRRHRLSTRRDRYRADVERCA